MVLLPAGGEITMSELSAEHAQLLFYSWAGGGSDSLHKNKLTLPNQVTTSRRGPLSLQSHASTSQTAYQSPPSLHPLTLGVREAQRGPHFLPPPLHHFPRPLAPHHRSSRSLARRRLLCRLPVVMAQQPLELVEKELEQGSLTCAQLSQTMEVGRYSHVYKSLLF